jgi:hypothetical protein
VKQGLHFEENGLRDQAQTDSYLMLYKCTVFGVKMAKNRRIALRSLVTTAFVDPCRLACRYAVAQSTLNCHTVMASKLICQITRIRSIFNQQIFLRIVARI